MSKNDLLSLTVVVVLTTTNVCAQYTTGELLGKIVGPSGEPVESANIIVRSATLQGDRGGTSDANGVFRFSSLPVGMVNLHISHISFRSLQVNDVEIKLGAQTNLNNLRMEPGETNLEEIVIKADNIVWIAEFSNSLPKSKLDNMPVGRDYKSAMALMPQVNNSYFGDGLSINGSTGAEIMYFVNGANVTDNFSSQWTPTLNNTSHIPYNFIKEVIVKQSGYSAEFGRAIGGVVDVITESGSNKLTGKAYSYYSGSFLNANPEGGTTGSKLGKISNYDFGFSVGGPIVKDKLWYFAAYSYYHNERQTEIPGNGYYPDETVAHLFAVKFDWRVSKNTKMDVTILGDPNSGTPIMTIDASGSYVPDIIQDPDAMLAETENGGINVSITGETELSKKTYLSYSVSGYKKKVNFSSATDYGKTTPQFYDATTGTIYGGTGFEEDMDIDKQNIRLKLTRNELNHSIGAGVEYENNGVEGVAHVPSPGNILRYSDTGYFVRNYEQRIDVGSRYYSAFFQHDWQVTNALLLEIGVRWEYSTLRDDKISTQSFANQWQPRLGITWRIGAEQEHLFSVFYGRVYQALSLLYGFGYGSNLSESLVVYDENPRNPGAVPTDTLFQYVNVAPRAPENDLNNANFTDQFAIQYQHQLTRNIRASARVLFKKMGDAYMACSDTAFNGSIGNPGRGELSYLPRVRNDYAAIELGVTGNVIGGALTYSLYYVLSRNYGNYNGSWDQIARYYSIGSISFGTQSSEGSMSKTSGLLASDRTHSLKFNIAYKLRFGLVVGSYISLASGTPLNDFIPNPWQPWTLDLLSDRGSAGRLPTLWDVNLRFAYQKPGLPFRVSLDFFQIGNPQTVVDQVQLKYTDPDGTTPNPSYGKAVRRQPPTSLRIGLEYSF